MTVALTSGTTSIYWLIIGFMALALASSLIRNWLAKNRKENQCVEDKPWPLRINDNFLTGRERSLYDALIKLLGTQYVVCPKVRLIDAVVFAPGDLGNQRQNITNRIDRKRIDFLLLDAASYRPTYAIEIDDAGLRSTAAAKRDAVKAKALGDAGLTVVQLPAKMTYTSVDLAQFFTTGITSAAAEPTAQSSLSEVLCPQCQIPMVLRQATKGPHAGTSFYGCPNYPKCHETKPISE